MNRKEILILIAFGLIIGDLFYIRHEWKLSNKILIDQMALMELENKKRGDLDLLLYQQAFIRACQRHKLKMPSMIEVDTIYSNWLTKIKKH